MKLSIFSLRKILFQGDARSINAKTASGEITVLDHHRPFISVLEKGVVKIVDNMNKECYIQVRSGFLEVNPENQARLLVDEQQ